jgi:uncharacterized repeat protein (TIGR03803 family)
MRKTNSMIAKLAYLVLVVFGAATLNLSAQTFTVTANFDGGARNPEAALIEGLDAFLYGTSFAGGMIGPCSSQSGCGTVYTVGGGFATTLYSFCAIQGTQGDCTDGSIPISALVQASNGNLYGTTQGGNSYSQDPCGAYGCGTVFEFGLGKNTGPLTTLHTFSYTDGGVPTSGLVQAKNGNLYGTTTEGGTNGNYGTVFKMTLAGKLTTIYNFCAQANCADGYLPSGPLVQGTDGNFYGEAEEGGANKNAGTIFKISLQGRLTTLYSFCAKANCADGGAPIGGLIQATDGNFYGTTVGGGAHKEGTVFRITPAGKLTTLYSFCGLANCTDGSQPSTGVIQATDGNFYGTTYQGGTGDRGTIFQITPAGKFTSLYNFCSQSDCDDGGYPMAGLLQDTTGVLDGVTSTGGVYGFGTAYNISLGLSPFVIAIPGSGKVGAAIKLTEEYGASSVSFNGVPSAFTVSGSEISTNVPSGATTGSISVATPSGVINSNFAFKVIPQLKQFSPTSGPVGTHVTITGISLSQTTEVTIGGAKASFSVSTDSQVTATVPSEAKTGKVVVSTLGGIVASASSFTVTP